MNELKAIAALAALGRPEILKQFQPSSCIASTRIGLDALEFFGVKAEAMPLFVMVMNDEALKMMEAGVSQAEIAAEMRRWRPEEPGGPWSIGVGAEIKNSTGWAGHLMIALPQHHLLLDMSFDQASRPHKGLTFEPKGYLFPVADEAWWAGTEEREAFTTTTPSGERVGILLSHSCPDPEGYRHSLNWRRDSNVPGTRRAFRTVTGQIIRLMRQELAA